MMKHEFEKLTGCEVCSKFYSTVIEPMYMAAAMDKFQFCEFIKPSIEKISKQQAEEKKAAEMRKQKVVFIDTDGRTPNGCWHVGYFAKLTGVDIATGKRTVRNLTEEEFAEAYKHHDMWWNDEMDGKARGLGHIDYYDHEVILEK